MPLKPAKHTITTPHAAVIIWNYKDRVSQPAGGRDSSGTTRQNIDLVEEVIISTVSCVSIQTSKSKSQPEGSFNLVLAPYKNWVGAITPGSWCAILMSTEPITKQDLEKANRKKVKMIGKIESVRVQTESQSDGSRRTLYYVSGVDWGHIMNNVIYIDNLIASPKDPKTQGNTAALAIRKMLFGKNNTPQSYLVKDNLSSLLGIFGQPVIDKATAKTINRLGGTQIYNLSVPQKVIDYFDFKKTTQTQDKKKKIYTNVVTTAKKDSSRQLSDMISLITGYLKGKDTYEPSDEAYGYIDPFSLQGTNSFWQILLDNSNPVLNEMFCEMRWLDENSLALAVYNRIKPFSYKGYTASGLKKAGIRSFYQNLRTHELDNYTIMSINAGTNWRDKYNFVEIRPAFQDFNVIANWTAQKTQLVDLLALDREGFRPLIVSTKQFPGKGGNSIAVDMDKMESWCYMLREWFFDTHRLLNGTISMPGISDYIAVGDNIKIDAQLINPTPNMNRAMLTSEQSYLIAHVENISHTFTVGEDGARQYRTTIQFVRGIITDKNGVSIGDAAVDKYTTTNKSSATEDRNTVNTVTTSDKLDPDDPVKGR